MDDSIKYHSLEIFTKSKKLIFTIMINKLMQITKHFFYIVLLEFPQPILDIFPVKKKKDET